jgi:hypothetical protein
LASAVLSFNPRYLLLAYGTVIPGLALATWGARQSEKWLQDPRPDQQLTKALKGLSRGYRLHSYVLPAEHVISSPTGLYVLQLKPQDGPITCTGAKWHRPFNVRRLLRILSESSLGNPTKQARAEADSLQRFLSERLPDLQVPIQPAIVFTSPQADLNLAEPKVPTMPLSDLKSFLRDTRLGPNLPQESQKTLLATFGLSD